MTRLQVGGLGRAVDGGALERIRGAVARAFAVTVEAAAWPEVEFAYDAGRRQYGSIAVLEMVAGMAPGDGGKLLAVTERDLFIPVLTFVFGQAQLGGQAAVVSLARLRQEFYGLPGNQEVFLERAVKEALHETGHTYGLVHCVDGDCAMSLSTNVRQIDRKQAGFCAACEGRLRKNARE